MLTERHDFKRIVELYSAEILDRARQLLDDPRDAEEALQDILMRVYRGLKSFRGESGLRTWIHRITTNHCLKMRKRNRPVVESINVESETDRITRDAEGEFLAVHGEVEIRSAISRLPDKEAEAITLYCLHGMSYRQIAEIMRLPAGSVATCLRRGRVHIHLLLSRERKR
jgi:RNA polymerase sigma-70 factor (ECF subfamily)